MRNPSRRNKNIGTDKQGHGKKNRLVIPEPFYDQKIFWERLGKHKTMSMEIKGQSYSFMVEETLKSHAHACTVEDLIQMITLLPADHLEGLKYIILRQPKRKEQILSPVWGRLIYFYEYEDYHAPAIVIEAVDYAKSLIRDRKMRVEDQEEFARLVADGHTFKAEKRKYVAPFLLENVRNTQLYRTFLHEVGHYYQYLQLLNKGENGEDAYERLPLAEKEKFAHTYADKMATQLKIDKHLPFPRILNEAFLVEYELRLEDF